MIGRAVIDRFFAAVLLALPVATTTPAPGFVLAPAWLGLVPRQSTTGGKPRLMGTMRSDAWACHQDFYHVAVERQGKRRSTNTWSFGGEYADCSAPLFHIEGLLRPKPTFSTLLDIQEADLALEASYLIGIT